MAGNGKQWDRKGVNYVRLKIESGKKEGLSLSMIWDDLADSLSVNRESIVAVYYRYVKKNKLPPKQFIKQKKYVYDNALKNEDVFIGVPWPPSSGRCNSIIGEPKNLVCCGEKTSPGHSFCPHHENLYYDRTKRC